MPRPVLTKQASLKYHGNPMFEGYLKACYEGGLGDISDETRDKGFLQGVSRVEEYLQEAGDTGACLICLGNISPNEAVWQCEEACHVVLHLICVQDWARSQLATASAQLQHRLDRQQFPAAHKAAQWGCPKCRQPYQSEDIPSTYRCFCGKVEDPEWDPWLTPHTCGELCGKPLPGACPHHCLLLCHPGPCPPCPVVVDVPCHCGRVVKKQRCGQPGLSCGAVCGRLLKCGHRCPEACHEGECPPCREVGKFKCQCQAEERELVCSERHWQCKRVCDRLLACGRHHCEHTCHAGPCGACPYEGVRTCPCGARVYPELKCDEVAPLCGGTCGKLLPCGRHHCTEHCHQGPCPQACRAMVTKSCRCGKTRKQVVCHQELTCEKKCDYVRNCGRHACKRRCCDGQCPPCEEVCGRRLRCGHHKCPAPCHSGPCRPCPLTFTITCACAATRQTLPCGAESRAVPPRCKHPCQVPGVCRHRGSHPPHPCHYGPCPRCPGPCSTVLSCGHTCSSTACHDPAPAPVGDFLPPKPPKPPTQESSKPNKKKKEAGASLPPVASAISATLDLLGATPSPSFTPCLPCSVPQEVPCYGNHVRATLPCHRATPFSCNHPCGVQLPCGNHRCMKACHTLGSVPCDVCTLPCAHTCPVGHPCPQQCHPGNCPVCEVEVQHACHCGKTLVSTTCHTFQQYLNEEQAQAGKRGGKGPGMRTGDLLCCGRPCHRALPHCPHPCQAICHLGPCPGVTHCEEQVTVKCKCKRRREKWPCHQVQAALLKCGKSQASLGNQALRLLPCSDECVKAEAQQPHGMEEEEGTEVAEHPAEVESRSSGPVWGLGGVLPCVSLWRRSGSVSAKDPSRTSSGSIDLVAGTPVAPSARVTVHLVPTSEPLSNMPPTSHTGGDLGTLSKSERARLRRAEREQASKQKADMKAAQHRRKVIIRVLYYVLLLMVCMLVGLVALQGLKILDEQMQMQWRIGA